ncbi:sulfate ABC transporter substrate-binding protein, partial [Pseudomonas syringae pv. tagetis]
PSTFTNYQLGVVLVPSAPEAAMMAREFGRDQCDVVYPSVAAQAEPPGSVVDTDVDKKKSRALAEDYLQNLWSPVGQEIAAKTYL